MELRGLIFAGVEAPLKRGYLPLGSTTVLLGPNDAGKSTTLRLLSEYLSPQAGTGRRGVGHGAVFIRPSLADLLVLASEALHSDVDIDFDQAATGAELQGYRIDAVKFVAQVEDHDCKTWRTRDLILRTLVMSAAGVMDQGVRASSHHHDLGREIEHELDEALLAEDTLAAEFVGWDRGDPTFRFWACLPKWDDLSVSLREALEQTRYSPVGAAEPPVVGWLHRDAPIPVQLVAETALPLLPRPLFLPTSVDGMVRDLEASIERLVIKLREYESQSQERPDVSESWTFAVAREAQAVAVHPIAVAVCSEASRAITHRLPWYISAHYRMSVEPLRPDRWESGRRTAFQVIDDRNGESFELQDLAAGFQVWAQLALVSVIAAIEDHAAALTYIEHHDEGSDPPVDDPLTEAIVEFSDALAKGEVPSLTDRGGPIEALVGWVHARAFTRSPEARAYGLSLTRPRVYLIDEPEQFLHPRLVAAAGSWLEDEVASSSGSALASTHSPALLNLRSSTDYVYVRRGLSETDYKRFEARDLRAADEMAAEMGFDRGELLFGLHAVLFVEGRMDQIVLSEIVGEELRSARIALAVFGGVGNIEDVMRNPLLTFTNIPVAVLVDNMAPEEFDLLRGNADGQRTALASGSDEQRAVVRLLRSAAELDRQVEPVGLWGKDIFDLLNDEDLRICCETWPGHQQARRDYEEHRASVSKRIPRKDFYKKRYGMHVTPSTCATVAKAMAQKGRKPRELLDLVERVERLGLASGLLAR